MENMINKKNNLIINFQAALLLSLLTVIKYCLDNFKISTQQPFIAQLYSFLFFITYIVGLFWVLWKIRIKNFLINSYGDYWFTGFRAVLFICILQIMIALIMEFLFPNIRLEFLQEQAIQIKKAIFNKENAEQTIQSIYKYYYVIKVSLFMFGLLILGTFLNTILSICIFLYFKQKRKS